VVRLLLRLLLLRLVLRLLLLLALVHGRVRLPWLRLIRATYDLPEVVFTPCLARGSRKRTFATPFLTRWRRYCAWYCCCRWGTS
jgi:hypothetical protein